MRASEFHKWATELLAERGAMSHPPPLERSLAFWLGLAFHRGGAAAAHDFRPLLEKLEEFRRTYGHEGPAVREDGSDRG